MGDNSGDNGSTVAEIDAARHRKVAYEYLCHLEEAKVWIESCIDEELPPTPVLEENLRNGVYLAKLASFFAPSVVSREKIYDAYQEKYASHGLQFRHTENISRYLQALQHIGLPKIFHPETTDIYERKNMPRAVYSVHALGLYLYRLGRAPALQDLLGKATFTADEVAKMAAELKRRGMGLMPQFGRIGGMLARDLPKNEAEVHAAIIAINVAILKGEVEPTIAALMESAAGLKSLEKGLGERYQRELSVRKEEKRQEAAEKSRDADYVPDAYDEMLTKSEIQTAITDVNIAAAIEQIARCVHSGDAKNLFAALSYNHIGLKGLNAANKEMYLVRLGRILSKPSRNNNTGNIDRDGIQRVIRECNEEASSTAKRDKAVADVNSALTRDDPDRTMAALKIAFECEATSCDFAAVLYHEEMRSVRADLARDLTAEEVRSGVAMLHAVATVTVLLLSRKPGSMEAVWKALNSPRIHLEGLEADLKSRYFQALCHMQELKVGRQERCLLLTHLDLQDCVDLVNMRCAEDNEKIEALGSLNLAMEMQDMDATMAALRLPAFGLTPDQLHSPAHLYGILRSCFDAKKADTGDVDATLWLEDVQRCVGQSASDSAIAAQICAELSEINRLVDANDEKRLVRAIDKSGLKLHVDRNRKGYIAALRTRKMGKSGGDWVTHQLRDGLSVSLNLATLEHRWDATSEQSRFLSSEDIRAVIQGTTDDTAIREQLCVRLQAVVRGYLARKRFRRIRLITRLQARCRGKLARLAFASRLQSEIEKRKRQQIDPQQAAVTIQRAWRESRSRLLASLVSNAPSLEAVRRCIHLLDVSDVDLNEEQAMQALKAKVVRAIRGNQQLERDLDRMDIRIGLLVRNRMTLQDAPHHEETSCSTMTRGLKGLNRCSRERLESYQHLFYLLQTRPHYLAKLMFLLPPSRTTKFLETVALSVFNFGANQREEYLLLKLFETALREEVRVKVEKVSDVITGNPMVVRMIVNYNRNERGQSSLRDLLGPLVTRLLADRNLHISTNPVEVYKAWVSQMETQTGKPAGLPYSCTQEEALAHEVVRKRLEQAIESLKWWTSKFLGRIVRYRDRIPYGMLYMGRVMAEALKERFPQCAEKDILKAVGNLVYYRFLNSAVVAPDAFDIVPASADRPLTNDQRRNLGSVAKILQFASTKKGFGDESPHLVCLNSFIVECHERFKSFFRQCCQVDPPEDRFGIDRYSEATLISKPVVYLTVQEVVDTHQLLVDNLKELAPDPNDPLHELLSDLGLVPAVAELVSDDPTNGDAVMGKSEVCLTLNDKFGGSIGVDESASEMEELLVRTKRMLVSLLPCTDNASLPEALAAATTQRQESLFVSLQERRLERDRRAQADQSILRRENSFLEHKTSLAALKSHAMHNLHVLETVGLVTPSDGYQSVLTSLARSITESARHRETRRSELIRLTRTYSDLEAKRHFYEDQRRSYELYLRKCLDSMSTSVKEEGKSIKYTGAKLHERGVLLGIEGLPHGQLRNVQFEITPTGRKGGLFEVQAKFLGVAMERVELDIQELLRLQFDGVAVMDMFGKARVNVNLILHLLNRKFYGKGK